MHSTMQITYPDGIEARSFPVGTFVRDIIPKSFHDNELPLLAVYCSNKMMSLNDRLDISCECRPIYGDCHTGSQVFRRSLSFVFVMACQELFPGRRCVISHTIGHSLFWTFEGMDEVPEEEIDMIRDTMKVIIDSNYAIRRAALSYQEAISWCENSNMPLAADLLKTHNHARVFMNVCNGFKDRWFSPLVSSTGIIKHWDVRKYRNGLTTHYPGTKTPNCLTPFVDNENLYNAYQAHQKWGECIDCTSVASLNQKLTNGGTLKEFVLVVEARMRRQLMQIVDNITCDHKLILISGPSSSGKTTFSKRLSVHLRAMGRKPVVVSLDDYYVNRVDTPLDSDGEYDFEAVEALDLPHLNKQLAELVAGEEVETPIFDFKTGTRKDYGHFVKMPEGGILVMEGLHALNERLTETIPREQKFKIFISPLTQLNIDDHTRIATSDSRLIRRIVRDAKFRGYSAEASLERWGSVLRGEILIYTYQRLADYCMNSAIEYEMPILKTYAAPLLKNITPNSCQYGAAQRLLAFMDVFRTAPASVVPPDSILREFIGGSYFNYN
ncbi:hypothetical protein PCE1_004412 [Barthelona sp. PCE]